MTISNDPDEIRADIERTRGTLSNDVDDLAESVKPKSVARRQVDKVKDAVGSVTDRVMGSDEDDPRSSTVADKADAAKDAVADKAYAGFTSSQTLHGGQETTLQALYTSFMHWGGIIVAPGYTDGLKFVDGNPYGVGHVTGPNNTDEINDATKAALEHLGTRLVTVAGKLAS